MAISLSRAFVERRLHSLTGLGLALFLFEHLLTNSEATLPIGHDGEGFIRMVNFIHSLPYLKVIELSLIGIPLLIHGWWGIQYLLTSKPNSMRGDGSQPALNSYGRNHAFTWQRLTSWVLLIGLILHIGQMRFLLYPTEVTSEGEQRSLVKISMDPGLYTLQKRLDVELFDADRIASLQYVLKEELPSLRNEMMSENKNSLNERQGAELQALQRSHEEQHWVQALAAYDLKQGQVVASAPDMGTAILLNVRDTFKSPFYCLLYTLFLFAGTFHAYNGLWTFMITWGLMLTERSQRGAQYVTLSVMGLMTFLGLAAIWGSYFVNLTY